MTRSNGDEKSQRQLLLELRNAIDRAREIRYFGWTIEPLACMYDVRALIELNPHGAISTHVQYNLAKSRREWLTPLFERMDMVAKNTTPPVDTAKDALGKPIKSPPMQIKGTVTPTKKG